MQVVFSRWAYPRAACRNPVPGSREVQHVEFPAGIPQQVRQVMQTFDVLEPERLPGEGDRPVLTLTPAHRPRRDAVRGPGRPGLRLSRVAVPAGAGQGVAGLLREAVIPSRVAVPSAAASSPTACSRSPG